MSALIPMKKLPDNCAIGGRDGLGCPCFCNYNEMCQLLGETIHTAYFSDEKRPERCPLQFVPPHGRLIEESKVLDIVSEWCPDDDGSVGKVGDPREMLDEIEALPTIIPAEEVEA